ncbi:putative holin [Chitinimonas koreensis]|uniref:putative holin n=1 Tax=Chitinimonas koreensis TaxID=356302 RepID=UPI0004119D89|nr:putative holin [Chitinimonas koreensis]QNM96384.1 phage holin family protein [Chitinimonas koreensis]
MAEPITATTSATPALLGVTLLALFPGLDAATVLGAFAGAAVFVVSARELTRWQRLAYFAAALAAGVVLGRFAADLLTGWLPMRVAIPAGVGALLSSAVVIKLLLWLIGQADNPAGLLAELLDTIKQRGGRP